MKTGRISGQPGYWLKWSPQLLFTITLLMVCGLMIANAQAFDITVTGRRRRTGSGYRWLLEEDATYHVDPNDPDS